MSELKPAKLKVEPYKFYYHSDWDGVITKIIHEYESRFDQIDTEISVSFSDIFKVFTLPFKDKKILLIQKNVLPFNSNGIPFQCKSLDNDQKIISKEIQNFVDKLCVIKKYAKPKNYDITKVPEVMVWSMTLFSNPEDKDYYENFWKNINELCLNHMSIYIKIFCFFGNPENDNLITELSSKKVSILKTYSLVNFKNCFLKEDNMLFQIIDQFFLLNRFNPIQWNLGLVY